MVIFELELKAPEERYGTKMYEKLQDSEREIKDRSFDSNTKSLKQDNLDIFEGMKSHVMYTAQNDENSDIVTTDTGMPKRRRQDKMKVEHKAPIIEDCYICGKLLDGIECEILIDVGAIK